MPSNLPPDQIRRSSACVTTTNNELDYRYYQNLKRRDYETRDESCGLASVISQHTQFRRTHAPVGLCGPEKAVMIRIVPQNSITTSGLSKLIHCSGHRREIAKQCEHIYFYDFSLLKSLLHTVQYPPHCIIDRQGLLYPPACYY